MIIFTHAKALTLTQYNGPVTNAYITFYTCFYEHFINTFNLGCAGTLSLCKAALGILDLKHVAMFCIALINHPK